MSNFKLFIKRIYLIILIWSIPSHVSATDSNGYFTVVIDAGHGGKDIGATDNGQMEKNINLAVAKQLNSLIKKKLKNVKVVMTRDKDTYLTLQERADIANNSKGDLFISIHTNSVDKKNKNRKTVKGSSVYALGLHKDDNNMAVARRENSVIELENNFEQKYSGFDPSKDESYIIFEMAQKKNLSKSIKFAEDIEKELVASGRVDRGVHQAGFWVLWATSMPSVLVELDFICNPESAGYLGSEKGAKELAEAIFKAFNKYYSTWTKNEETMISDLATTRQGNIIVEERLNEDSDNEVSNEENLIQNYGVASKRKKKEITDKSKNTNREISSKRKRRSKSEKEKTETLVYEVDYIPLSNEDKTNSEFIASISDNTEKTILSSEKNNKKKKENNKVGKKENKKNHHNAKISKVKTVYKIQILACEEKLGKKDSRFCGLSPITVVKDDNTYKYLYGESNDREEIELLLSAVKKKIPDAFIVSMTKSYNK